MDSKVLTPKESLGCEQKKRKSFNLSETMSRRVIKIMILILGTTKNNCELVDGESSARPWPEERSAFG